MISLTDYITESFQENVINLEQLPEDKRSLGKLKILIQHYDKIGNDIEQNGESHFDTIFKYIERNDEKKFKKINDLRHEIYKYDDVERSKVVTKFLNAVFSYYKSEYNYSKKKEWYIDDAFLAGAVIGCAEYMDDLFSNDTKLVDKYMGKLLTAYKKITGNSFDDFFDVEANRYAQARAIYDKEMKTISDFKAQMKDFKYVYYCGGDEAHGEIHIYETGSLSDFDEGFEKTKDAVGTCAQYYFNYDPNEFIKHMLKNNGKLNMFTMGHSLYYFDEIKDDEHAVYKFGFINELPKTFGIYSAYNQKMRYGGKLYKDNDGHHSYYDSLWTEHSK